MDHKILIIILSAIIVILSICAALMFLDNMNHSEIEYEKYTVNGTGTTIEIPVKSKIVEKDELINIQETSLYYQKIIQRKVQINQWLQILRLWMKN